MQGIGGVSNPQAAIRRVGGQEHKPHQEQVLAEQREAHVDGACTARGWRPIVSHQPVGREADKRVRKEEAQEIRRDENPQASNEREEPADRKAPSDGSFAEKRRRVKSRRDPQQRRRSQKHGAGGVEHQRHVVGLPAQHHRGIPSANKRGSQRWHGSDPKQLRHDLPQTRGQARQQHGDRQGQGGEEQQFGIQGRVASGSCTRPIWSSSTGFCGNIPTSNAQTARASTTISRSRDTGAVNVSGISESASAGTRARNM